MSVLPYIMETVKEYTVLSIQQEESNKHLTKIVFISHLSAYAVVWHRPVIEHFPSDYSYGFMLSLNKRILYDSM